jgi:protein SCO1/2
MSLCWRLAKQLKHSCLGSTMYVNTQMIHSMRLTLFAVISATTVFAAEQPPKSKSAAAADTPKCCCTTKGVSLATASYHIPKLKLVNRFGKTVLLSDELSDTKPVVMQFAFTSCSTICPVASGTLAAVQKELGDNARRVQFRTVSIDPDYDTPERLAEYAKSLKATTDWHFLTGTTQDIATIQKAFNAYVPNKSRHEPLTFLRAAKSGKWTRVTGLMSSKDMSNQVRQLLASTDAR